MLTNAHTLILINYICLCQGSGLQCPNANMNTQNRENAKLTEGVASWAACSELCRQREDCSQWTWATENKCWTMTGFGNTAEDPNFVSGDRNCEGCPMVKVTTQNRHNEEWTNGVESWGGCSELCRQRADCTDWTWADENSGQGALKCVTMTGYGHTKFDSNAVSGARNCIGCK